MSWRISFYSAKLEQEILELPPTNARSKARDQLMSSRLDKFKARALTRPGVRAEYDNLAEEFELLDEILKARAEAGLTQAELAQRIGTTQSAVARMESAIANGQKHSPTIATLRRYAAALGYRIQVRFVKDKRARSGARRGR